MLAGPQAGPVLTRSPTTRTDLAECFLPHRACACTCPHATVRAARPSLEYPRSKTRKTRKLEKPATGHTLMGVDRATYLSLASTSGHPLVSSPAHPQFLYTSKFKSGFSAGSPGSALNSKPEISISFCVHKRPNLEPSISSPAHLQFPLRA